MLFRLKFRIHGGADPGKFIYNVQEGSTLYFNEGFRPFAGGAELATYCVLIRNRKTSVAFLKAEGAWNGQIAKMGPVEVRPGHTFETSGLTVEILECPEPPNARADREVTRFIDLAGLQAHHPFSTPEPTAPKNSGDAPPPFRPSFTHAHESDVPDRVVVPISLEPASDPAAASFYISTPADSGTRSGQMIRDEASLKPMPNHLLRAGAVALLFSALILGSNLLAKRFLFNFGDEDYMQMPVIVQVPVRARPREAASANAASRMPASAAVAETSVTPPEPAKTEIMPLPVISGPEPSAEAAKAPKSSNNAELREFTAAVDEGNLLKVSHLIETANINPDFALDDLGRSPFVKAASAGRVTVMQYLLSKKVSVTAADYNGNNALMWATINGHEKTVKFLLTLGLDPEAKRDDGKNALQLARQYRQNSVAKLLSTYKAPAPVGQPPKPASTH